MVWLKLTSGPCSLVLPRALEGAFEAMPFGGLSPKQGTTTLSLWLLRVWFMPTHELCELSFPPFWEAPWFSSVLCTQRRALHPCSVCLLVDSASLLCAYVCLYTLHPCSVCVSACILCILALCVCLLVYSAFLLCVYVWLYTLPCRYHGSWLFWILCFISSSQAVHVFCLDFPSLGTTQKHCPENNLWQAAVRLASCVLFLTACLSSFLKFICSVWHFSDLKGKKNLDPVFRSWLFYFSFVDLMLEMLMGFE